MKNYLKDRTNWIALIVMLIALTIIYCGAPNEKPSRTVDEIIEQNRQIRLDTTDTTIVK